MLPKSLAVMGIGGFKQVKCVYMKQLLPSCEHTSIFLLHFILCVGYLFCGAKLGGVSGGGGGGGKGVFGLLGWVGLVFLFFGFWGFFFAKNQGHIKPGIKEL